ncbi:hypothetical protein EEJ42_35080, partial [Streptomyces botrytidirepellens]
MAGELGFTPHLRVEPVPGEAVYLVSEHGVTALHGRAIAALAPLLDGSRDLAHILTEAARAAGCGSGLGRRAGFPTVLRAAGTCRHGG